MIHIKQVTCKNFLSYGNTPYTFKLDTHRSTLIRGRNGHGKSTILDVIMFALYGKPYRNINKPQLINSINKAELLVEIDFVIAGIEYKVVRGLKPNVFDIFKNGVLVEQDAAMRDYQELLETQILKVGEKTFKQIAVLGSASYVPFMQLGAGQRRELIESILDIEIFSQMNIILKDRVAATKEEYKSAESVIAAKKAEAVAQQKLISVMKNNTKDRITELQEQRKQLVEHSEVVSGKIEALNEQLSRLVEPEFDEKRFEKLEDLLSTASRAHKSLLTQIARINELDECPTCLQKVTEDHAHSVESDLSVKATSLTDDIAKYKEELQLFNAQKEQLFVYTNKVQEIKQEIQLHVPDLNYTIKNIHRLDESIASYTGEASDIDAEEAKLKKIAAEAITLIERKNALSEEKHLQEVAIQLLKDTGIKTSVVKEYLPILNQLINKYLAMFDFFVDFTLDESFTEVIRSRGRDIFSYSNFSEGEKRKIDFSILMAFRQLAALKNSAKTNLLMFDEILDGNLDLNARDVAHEIITNIPDANVIVISHASANPDDFDRILQVEKQGDFSVVTDVS